MQVEHYTFYRHGSNATAFTILISELIPYSEYTLTTPIEARVYVYDANGVHTETVIACGVSREKALSLLAQTVKHVRRDYSEGHLLAITPYDPVVHHSLFNVEDRIKDLLAA